MSFGINASGLQEYNSYLTSRMATPKRAEATVAPSSATPARISGDTINISPAAKNIDSGKTSKAEKLDSLTYNPVHTLTTKNGNKVSIDAAWDVNNPDECVAVRVTIVKPDGSSETFYLEGNAVLSEKSDGTLQFSDPGDGNISCKNTDDIIIAMPSKNNMQTRSINAGDGDNTIIDLSGGNTGIKSGNGNDTIIGKGGDFTIDTGGGNDIVMVTGNRAIIRTGAGADAVTVSARYVDIDMGDGDDTARVTDASEGVIQGQTGNDYIEVANSSNLTIDTGEGDDTISIIGQLKDSQIYAGDGNDEIHAESIENTTIDGGNGNDRITIQSSRNAHITGGAGNDMIDVKQSYNDNITGGGGDDTVSVERADKENNAPPTLPGRDSLAGLHVQKNADLAAGITKDTIYANYIRNGRSGRYFGSV